MKLDTITITKQIGTPVLYQADTPSTEHLNYYGIAKPTPQEALEDLMDKIKDI